MLRTYRNRGDNVMSRDEAREPSPESKGLRPAHGQAGTGPVDTRPKPLARATERHGVDRLYHAIADLAEAGREDFEIEWLEKNRQRIKDAGFDTDTTA